MKIKDRARPKIPPVEPGVYIGVCIGVIDLGEQYSEKFKNYANKVKVVWEIPSETVEVDGEQKPRQLSKDFSFALSNKSSLRKFLQSWNGKTYTDDEFGEFDLFSMLGKACQISVVLNETGEYANIDNLMALPKGFPAPQTQTPYVTWDMDNWDEEKLASLPEWYQEQIKKSTQYQKLHAPTDEVRVDAPEDAGAVQAAPGERACPI